MVDLRYKGTYGRLSGMLFGVWTVFVMVVSVWAHEKDMHNNCSTKGASYSWFYEINCKELEEYE